MTSNRRLWWRLLALMAVLGLVAAACGDDSGDSGESSETTFASEGGELGEQEDAVAAYGGDIAVGLEGESQSWTPGQTQWTVGGLSVGNAIYDPFIVLDGNGEYKPFLAESLTPNADLTEWTVVLRDGVTFHDGTPLDAAAVKWNFDNLINAEGANTQGTLTTAGVTGMEIVDDMSVVYVLSDTNAAFPDLLRGTIGMPVSPTAYEADPEGFNDGPVGTGPFVFDEWVRDGYLRTSRNPDYWMSDENGQQLPYLNSIEFRPIADENVRALALSSDDIQVMQTLRGSTAKQVIALVDDDDRSFNAVTYVGNQSGSAIFNTLEPPLDDVRVRRALAMASDGELVAQVLGDDGLVPRSTGFFSTDSPWYSEAAANAYPGTAGRDLEGAIALREEYENDPARSDGRAPGEPVTLTYSCLPDASLLQVAQLQQSLWSEAGFEVDLSQVEQAELISNAIGTADSTPPWRGTYSANCWRSPALTGDPYTDFVGFFGPVDTSVTNFTNFTDPQIDAALETLRTSADFDERYAAVETIGMVNGENVAIAFSSATPTLVGYRGDIYGIPTWHVPDGALGSGIPGGVMRFHEAFIATQ
jgi:peptide/nickel transport system substrate-binding protein